jgi:hypothetical protein
MGGRDAILSELVSPEEIVGMAADTALDGRW